MCYGCRKRKFILAEAIEWKTLGVGRHHHQSNLPSQRRAMLQAVTASPSALLSWPPRERVLDASFKGNGVTQAWVRHLHAECGSLGGICTLCSGPRAPVGVWADVSSRTATPPGLFLCSEISHPQQLGLSSAPTRFLPRVSLPELLAARPSGPWSQGSPIPCNLTTRPVASVLRIHRHLKKLLSRASLS